MKLNPLFLGALLAATTVPAWADLQLYLPFDSSSLVGGNLISPDASGYGRDAYLNLAATNVAYGVSGATILANGRADGGALQLDGVNDFARVLGWSGISGNGARSISLWVNQSPSTLNPNDIWAGWGDVGAGTRVRWDFGLDNSTSSGMRLELNSGFSSKAGGAIADNNWHMVTVTYAAAATTVNFYLDGVLYGIGTTMSGTPATTITGNFGIAIGAGIREVASATGNANRFVTGLIDDLRIYDTELTGTEVANLFAVTVPEPSSLAIVGLGAFACLLRRRFL